MGEVCEKLGIDFEVDDPLSMMEADLKFNAIIRYKYADFMLEARQVQINNKNNN
jgi:hypothetical protein